ncbi:MAG: hypothetical protein F4066_11880 [Chloroflexi bacterium]|nr:hypothetical protein [Chloroflexota bacterium]
MERLTPELVEVIEPEKLVDPIFRDSLLQDLGPALWAVAEPQVQTAVATAITDNFLLAAAIVFIAVLAILRLREIPLRSGNLPAAVNVERPDQPSDPASISVSEQPRVIEFPILEPKSRTAGNGRTALLELHDLRLRSQVSGRAEPERMQAAAAFERPSVRRVMIAGAMIGAGVGLAISLVSAKNGTR